ncbi:MAG: phosphatase PAP2 family protein [Actinomycetota bacterium]
MTKRVSVYKALGWYLGGLLATILLLILIDRAVLETAAIRGLLSLDRSLLLAIHRLSNPLLDSLMIFITYLGSRYVVAILFLLAFVVLAYRRLWQSVLSLTVVTIGAGFIDLVMKAESARPRPLFFRVIPATGFSFPSGHALLATVFYGMIAFILYTRARSKVSRILVVSSTAALVLLIGFSRLYLGVHWPSDVLGGYIVGLLWLFLSIRALHLVERRWS